MTKCKSSESIGFVVDCVCAPNETPCRHYTVAAPICSICVVTDRYAPMEIHDICTVHAFKKASVYGLISMRETNAGDRNDGYQSWITACFMHPSGDLCVNCI